MKDVFLPRLSVRMLTFLMLFARLQISVLQIFLMALTSARLSNVRMQWLHSSGAESKAFLDIRTLLWYAGRLRSRISIH